MAVPDQSALRKLLQATLRSDSDLEAFCSDYFPAVAGRFTSGMDRVQKVTTLLAHAKPAHLVEMLCEAYPQAAGEIDAALRHAPAAASPADEGRLFCVPELPPHFLGRSGDLAGLKTLILNQAGPAVAVTGRAARTGVQGMGGIGKTVLAASLARESHVRRAFPDGIFWVTLGQHPPLVQRQAELSAALGESAAAFDNEQQGRARLTELLADRACLLVLDDVWQLEHVTAFGATGPRGRVLFTTRDASIAAGLGAAAHRLDVLGEAEALKLLADWSGQPPEALPIEARLVVRECGCLPLALAMIGATVRGRPERWGNALYKLRHADLAAIRRSFPDYPYPDLLRAIEVSLDALDPAARARYLDFAVFAEDTPVPEAVLQTLWKPLGMTTYDTQDMLDLLVDRSLLRRDDRGRLMLHDLQRDYLVKHAGDLAPLHARLLDAYAACCRGGWANGPDDGYFFMHLAYHLMSAGRDGELRRTLFDFEWLAAKLKTSDPAGLLADFACLRSDPTLGLLEQAIRLSAHILATERAQLASQLIGRLQGEPDAELQALLAKGVQLQAGPWLRPLNAGLTRPGGPLVRTLAGHAGGVMAVCVTPDGRWAVSASPDWTLKVWELSSGHELRTLSGHSGRVEAVAVTPDGQWAISGSSDRTLKVWELSSGKELRTLSGHSAGVRAVAVTPDGQWAISGSDDRTLKCWELSSGRELFTLSLGRRGALLWGRIRAVAVTPDGSRIVFGSSDYHVRVWDLKARVELFHFPGHLDWVNAVAITPDGNQAISASGDSTLKVWDLSSGRELYTLSGHTGAVRAVVVTPDGRHAVSGSQDQMLKVWDLSNGSEIRSLVGHSDWVKAVALTPDGLSAISGADDDTLKVWDLRLGQELASLSRPSATIRAVAVTRDGQYAVSGSDDCTLKVWELPSGREIHTLSGHTGRIAAVAVTPDGKWAVSGASDKRIRGWELSTGRELFTWRRHEDRVGALAITPDGKSVISGGYDQMLKVSDLASGEEVRAFNGRAGKVRALVVTPDGTRVISGSEDCTIKIWELSSGQELFTLSGHSDWVRALAVSPDGHWVVSGSDDRTVKVWDLVSRRELQTLSEHGGKIRTVVVTPDGQWVLLGSSDGTLQVRHLRTRSVLATFVADSPIFAATSAPDGRTVVAGDALGTMHFLRLEGI